MNDYLTGTMLRQQRISLNLSIDDISRLTYIRGTFLTAIENNQFDGFPSLAVARGFIRNYAFAVNLDGDRILRQFNRELSTGKIKLTGSAALNQSEDIHKSLVQSTEIIPRKRSQGKRRHFTAAEWGVLLTLGCVILAVWIWAVYL